MVESRPIPAPTDTNVTPHLATNDEEFCKALPSRCRLSHVFGARIKTQLGRMLPRVLQRTPEAAIRRQRRESRDTSTDSVDWDLEYTARCDKETRGFDSQTQIGWGHGRGRSTTGYVLLLGGGAGLWISKKQTEVAVLSTTEAELHQCHIIESFTLADIESFFTMLSNYIKRPFQVVKVVMKMIFDQEPHRSMEHIRPRRFTQYLLVQLRKKGLGAEGELTSGRL
jgi:hypothetical protein